jgi:hypothetical protein
MTEFRTSAKHLRQKVGTKKNTLRDLTGIRRYHLTARCAKIRGAHNRGFDLRQTDDAIFTFYLA